VSAEVESDVEASASGRPHQIGAPGETFPCGARIGWFLAEGADPPAASTARSPATASGLPATASGSAAAGARATSAPAAVAGDPARGALNEPSAPSILDRLGRVAGGHWDTRQAPTTTQRESLEIARGGFQRVSIALRTLLEETLAELEADMEAAGAPWTPGRRVG